MRTIAVINQKGGCGKTITAINLSAFLAREQRRVLIVPMDPSFFALHGIGKLLETFEVLVKDTGHQIVPRVLVTLYSGRSPFVKAVVDEIRHHLDGRHFDVVIRYSIKLAEAASHGVPIVDYCRHCAGFDDYQALAAEVLRQEADFPDAEPVAIRQNGSARNGSADQNEGADEHHEGLSAPASTPEGVMSTVEASDAEQVHLAGDFNDWTLDGSEMELIDGIWTT